MTALQPFPEIQDSTSGLEWYDVTAPTAGGLVAAQSSQEALELIAAYAGEVGWFEAEVTDEPPGPPTAKGVYCWFAE